MIVNAGIKLAVEPGAIVPKRQRLSQYLHFSGTLAPPLRVGAALESDAELSRVRNCVIKAFFILEPDAGTVPARHPLRPEKSQILAHSLPGLCGRLDFYDFAHPWRLYNLRRDLLCVR